VKTNAATGRTKAISPETSATSAGFASHSGYASQFRLRLWSGERLRSSMRTQRRSVSVLVVKLSTWGVALADPLTDDRRAIALPIFSFRTPAKVVYPR
jgi:hypothetical protein